MTVEITESTVEITIQPKNVVVNVYGGKGAAGTINGQDHRLLSFIGSNTHAQIDAHIIHQDVSSGAVPNFNGIYFNTNPASIAHLEGHAHWDDDDKTLNLDTEVTGTVIQIGQEIVVRATNKTGAQVNDGQSVYVNDAIGNRPTIALTDAGSNTATARTIGMATHNIADNATGYVTTFGLVRGYDTRSFTAGDPLYVSQTPGELTNVEPSFPAHNMRMGYALNSLVNGIVFVSTQKGFHLENLWEVDISSGTENDYFTLVGSQWVNKTENTVRQELVGTDTKDPTGFINIADNNDTTMSFDNGTQVFTLTKVQNYDVYALGVKYPKTTNQTFDLSTIITANGHGTYYVYFGSDGVLTASFTPWDFDTGKIFVAAIYWDDTNNKGLITDERHGCGMAWSTHQYLHDTVGGRYESGFTISYPTNDGDDGSFSLTAGAYHDEDIDLSYGVQTQGSVFYRINGSNFTWDTASAVAYKTNAGVLVYDNAGTLTDLGTNRFVNYWLIASNDITSNQQTWSIMGQQEYSTLTGAMLEQFSDLTISNLPTNELIPLYRITYKQGAGTTKTRENTTDFRGVTGSASGSFTTNDHGALSGLSDDDHTQYTLLAGRSGGQSLIGGTDASENLTLISTSHATKGNIVLGTSGAFINDAGKLTVPTGGSAGLFFGDGDSGFFESADDTVWFKANGTDTWFMNATSFGTNTAGQQPFMGTGLAFTFVLDSNTGFSRVSADIANVTAGGIEIMRWDGNAGGTTRITSPSATSTCLELKLAALQSGPAQIWSSSGGTGDLGQIDQLGTLEMVERSSDPSDPAEGRWTIWMSDGTGSGDDGDIMMKITAGATTKTATLVDFSAA